MPKEPKQSSSRIRLFLSGDVMSGRGIDQILHHPGDSRLYEPYVKDARDYVTLAERANGTIDYPVGGDYVWGEALAELDYHAPQWRIINLETAITTSTQAWPNKGIHYKMHPRNADCLTNAGIDCCVLGNNHVLDWDYPGLADTLNTLQRAGIKTSGAGTTAEAAGQPAILAHARGARVLVFSYAMRSSGVPPEWAATARRGGVNLLGGLDESALQQVTRAVSTHRQAGDVVIASIHWGGNWGYAVESRERAFAQGLIDEAQVDIVHGHSSHHPRAMEICRHKPILYGCGDLINDYEGIHGHEAYRPDLALMYFISFDTREGQLAALQMSPMQLRRFRLHRASGEDTRWLQGVLEHESQRFKMGVSVDAGGRLIVSWT